jgi:hypothetical protein
MVSKVKNSLSNLTKLERHKELKKQVAEDAEKLEVLGQESDRKAAKWVQEVGKEERKKEEDRIADVMTKLDDNKAHVVTYKELLMSEMRKEMTYWDEDLPTGFQWVAQSTDKGIVLWIRNPKHEYYAKGIKPSGDPKVDLNAIARLIVTAVKEMTKQEEKKTENGIILPYK